MLSALLRLSASPLAVWVPTALVVLIAALSLTLAGSPPARRGMRRLWMAAVFVGGSLAVAGTAWQAQNTLAEKPGAALLQPDRKTATAALAARVKALQDRLARLQQRAPARVIAPGTAAGLAAYLKKSGSRTVLVSVIPGDLEAYDYANQLVALLRTAGWQASGPQVTRIFGDIRAVGVTLFANPQQASDTAKILADAFTRFNIPYEPRVTPSGVVPDSDAVELFVGALPGAKIASAPPRRQPAPLSPAPPPSAPVGQGGDSIANQAGQGR
jgi:ubiquinone biosynthesis protein UbiJ